MPQVPLEKLQVLTLFQNPVCMHPEYRHVVLNTLSPVMLMLDDNVVADEEVVDGVQTNMPSFGALGKRTFFPSLRGDDGLLTTAFWRNPLWIGKFLSRVRARASLGSAICCIQSVARMFVQRCKYIRVRDEARRAAKQIQRMVRGFIVRQLSFFSCD